MSRRRRWIRFNAIGFVGFLFQMVILAALIRWTWLTPPVAISAAVLVTVTHNFLWHERVTWRNQSSDGRLGRWVKFQLSTGVISVITNVGLTAVVARLTGLSVVSANVVAVATASIATFLVSDRLVFRQ
ncbi:MAG: GtrA family protein [Vicinamibacterales bacterium]